MHERTLSLATAHGATRWVKQFIKTQLPLLSKGAIDSEQFARLLTAELEARGLVTLSQQKNYRSNVVQALKVIDENHPAIALWFGRKNGASGTAHRQGDCRSYSQGGRPQHKAAIALPI